MTLSSKLEVLASLVEGDASSPPRSLAVRNTVNPSPSAPATATTMHCRPDQVTFLGSSMGGYVAALYAMQHPERVSRLVLLAPAFGFPTRWLERHPPHEVESWRETGFTTVYHAEHAREEQIGYQLVTDARQFPDYPEISPDIPILILHGRRDESVPISYSDTFLEVNPHARLAAYESDHSLLDVLDPLWKEIASFLDLLPLET
jgi:pimeloyl-ACP methyl ester carboxylesterase